MFLTSDDQLGALLTDATQVGDAIEVDEVRGLGEAQLHHRQKTVTTGQQFRLISEPREQGERLADRTRSVVFE